MSPSHTARCAQLARLLEVSATPKPGNIDRDHNYTDTLFEHFLASTVDVNPFIRGTEQIYTDILERGISNSTKFSNEHLPTIKALYQ